MERQSNMQKLAIDGGNPVRTKPFDSWPVFGELEEQSVLDVIRSGNWGGYSPRKIKHFEEKFARLQDAAHAIAVSNGTVAISVALLAAGVDIGDEVIMTPYTFVATPTAALLIGAIPVFADVDENMLLDPEKVEAAITSRTKAIIPVHVAGAPANMSRLKEIAHKHRIAIIEDAAQAVGAKWEGTGVGALGDMGTFSLQSGKNLNCGEGGVILTNNPELAERAWSIHNCGRIREGAWYQHENIGWNFRLTELQAALAIAQLSRLEQQMAARESNAALLTQLLDEIAGIKTLKWDRRITRHAYHIYMLRVDPNLLGGQGKRELIQRMYAEGVPVSSGYIPLNQNQAIISRVEKLEGRERRDQCPNAEAASEKEMLWLGQNLLLGTEEDMHDIAHAFRKVTASM